MRSLLQHVNFWTILNCLPIKNFFNTCTTLSFVHLVYWDLAFWSGIVEISWSVVGCCIDHCTHASVGLSPPPFIPFSPPNIRHQLTAVFTRTLCSMETMLWTVTESNEKKRARKWVEIRGRCRVDKCVLCRIPKGQLGQSHYHNQKKKTTKKTEKMQNGVHINEKYSRKKQKKNFLALESNDFRCLDSRGILNRQSRK